MGILLLWILAAALVAYSLMLVFLSNFNMGNLMVWVLTAAITACAIWHKPLAGWLRTGAGRVVGIVLGAGLRKDKPSMLLRYRLDKAYEYAAEHPDLLIVTSGGQGRDEWIPEGQAMRDYLIEKGLPADRVLAENKSTSTEENFAFSLDILKERGYSADTPIVYVSNAFHCYRAGRYAARAGFTTVAALPAHTPWRSVLPCYLREALALAYYWVFKTSTSGPMHAMVGLLDLNKRFFYK